MSADLGSTFVRVIRALRTQVVGAGDFDDDVDQEGEGEETGAAPLPTRVSARTVNVRGAATAAVSSLELGDLIEHTCTADGGTAKVYVGTVTAVTRQDDKLISITYDCNDDDTVAPGAITTTTVNHPAFGNITPITDGRERRTLKVRTAFPHQPTAEDWKNAKNGFKRRTSRWNGMMVAWHGNTQYTDSGVREATNKDLQRSYRDQSNKNPNKFLATMAHTAEREDRMMVQERLESAERGAGPPPSRRYTAKNAAGVHLAGRGTPRRGALRVCIIERELLQYQSACSNHLHSAIHLHLEDKASWAGTKAGSAPVLGKLSCAAGLYSVSAETPTVEAQSGCYRCLLQEQETDPDGPNNPTYMLVQAIDGSLDDMRLLVDTGDGKYTPLATVKINKTSHRVSLVLKHVSRRWLIEQHLLDSDVDDVVGNAKASIEGGVGFMELPEPPASLAPAGLPAGLAVLVAKRHAIAGEAHGPAELKMHCSLATTSGKVDATDDWRCTGYPRHTVATLDDKQHVIVRALFRSRRPGIVHADGSQPATAYEPAAMVTPLAVVPITTMEDGDEELQAMWARLGLMAFEVAGPDYLCEIGRLGTLPGYSSPVANGSRVVAVHAPWVGLRSATKRHDEGGHADDGDDDDDGALGDTAESGGQGSEMQ